MLDQYRRGNTVSLSTEAPVIDLRNPTLSEVPGGAANVAWNISLLGGSVSLIGVLGRDPEADSLKRLMAVRNGLNLISIEDSSRPTTAKIRFCNNQFHLLRISNESKETINEEVFMKCKQHLLDLLPKANAVFVQDYDKGVVRKETVSLVKELHAAYPQMLIALDPKPSNEKNYLPGMCSLIKPNWAEACALTKADSAKANPEEVAKELGDKFECDAVVTLGADGSVIYDRKENFTVRIPTKKSEVIDVSGAGDIIIGTVLLALTAGATLAEAAFIANLAGGIGVRKAGTCVVTHEELKEQISDPDNRHLIAKFAEELIKVETNK